jgi:hypothetical protein
MGAKVFFLVSITALDILGTHPAGPALTQAQL